MDYYHKINYSKPFIRQNTPSTTYSLYSTPALSPLHFTSSDYPESQKCRSASLALLFEQLHQKYLTLNTEKNRVNQSCINLINREKRLKSNQALIISKLQAQNWEKALKTLENQNLQGKKDLEKMVLEYFSKGETVRSVNFILKEIVDKNEIIEEIKTKFFKLNEQAKVLKTKKICLDNEQMRVNKEKKELSARRKSIKGDEQKAELGNKVLKDRKIEVSTTENVAAYLISQSSYTLSDLSNHSFHEAKTLKSLHSLRFSISSLKQSLQNKQNLFLQQSISIKALSTSITSQKSLITYLQFQLSQTTSKNEAKELFLSEKESLLNKQFQILEKTVKKCVNV